MIVAIVPAAGQGTRMGREGNKLFLPLGGKPILVHTLKALEKCGVNQIILAVHPNEIEWIREEIQNWEIAIPIELVVGGAERQDSVYEALQIVSKECQLVLVHDGARPFIKPEIVTRLLEEAKIHPAIIVAVPAKDTIKIADSTGQVKGTPDRSTLWQIQTPQCFAPSLLKRAYDEAKKSGFRGTDDASLVEQLGETVWLLKGDYQNIKITTPEDLIVAEAFLNGEQKMKFRIGKGYDVHQLVEGRPLILGGVEIPHSKGLLGHSDADVLAHAISDALLGAANLGDIGRHFPDTNPAFKGADSIVLLQQVVELLKKEGYGIGNVDATVMAERPKLAPYIPVMQERLAAAMEIEVGQLNIKATTTEKLGFVGREEGFAAEAIVLIEKATDK